MYRYKFNYGIGGLAGLSAGEEKERDKAEQGEEGGGTDRPAPHTIAEIILAVTVLVRLEPSVFVGLK